MKESTLESRLCNSIPFVLADHYINNSFSFVAICAQARAEIASIFLLPRVLVENQININQIITLFIFIEAGIKANEPFSRIVNFLNDSFGLLLMSWSERVQAIMMQLA